MQKVWSVVLGDALSCYIFLPVRLWVAGRCCHPRLGCAGSVLAWNPTKKQHVEGKLARAGGTRDALGPVSCFAQFCEHTGEAHGVEGPGAWGTWEWGSTQGSVCSSDAGGQNPRKPHLEIFISRAKDCGLGLSLCVSS